MLSTFKIANLNQSNPIHTSDEYIAAHVLQFIFTCKDIVMRFKYW